MPTLHVKVDASGRVRIKDGRGNPEDEVHSNPVDREPFRWIPDAGYSLKVDFPNGNPFDLVTPPPYSEKDIPCVRPDASVDDYCYTVHVFREGHEPVVHDPKVIIDDGLIKKHGATKAQAVVDSLIAHLNTPSLLTEGKTFFPRGIDVVSVSVKADGAEVSLTLSGPEPSSSE